jgi:hypothetical protein
VAQQVKIILVDDIDGGTADETVRFSLDGSQYEIDLSEKNAKAFREAVKPYTDKGRKVTARAAAGKSKPGPARNQEAAQIREWARANGYTISERGRVQSGIVEAYRRAHA